MVQIEIPIAPSDRALYSELLVDWPVHKSIDLVTTAFPVPESPAEEVRHIQTHRQNQGLPHSNTPAKPRSATFAHTESQGVRHIQTQGSATFVHRESESFKALLNTSTLKQKQHSEDSSEITVAAEQKTKKETSKETENLFSQVAKALRNAPDLPLYQATPITVWFREAWSEPVSPHTPAWLAMNDKKIVARDLFALILAISADPSIEHRPRYLSWLVQKWQANIESSPVVNWPRWQHLADIPIRDWNTRGRSEWIELAPSGNRELPFGLEELFHQHDAEKQSTPMLTTAGDQKLHGVKKLRTSESKNDHGLAILVGNGEISIRDVWRAALSQLSIKLHKSIYSNWVEGTRPVSYQDGILTLRARHFMAREQLSRRYNSVIEETVSDLAKEKITVRYILDEL